jgi:hypothetical protein
VKNVLGANKFNHLALQGAQQDEATIKMQIESITEGAAAYITSCLATLDAAVNGALGAPGASVAATTACPITPLTIISRRSAGKTSSPRGESRSLTAGRISDGDILESCDEVA